MPHVLPPGFSEASLRSVLAELALELGDGWVDAPDEPSPDHLDPFALGDPLRFAPSAVVRPGSVEEIQAVLRIANAHRLPLWTVSRGRNLGYGGTAPRVRGSVVVELSRHEPRARGRTRSSATRCSSPGVSFFDLYEHLRANGHRLWMSAPGLGWGSVVGNALERGFGLGALRRALGRHLRAGGRAGRRRRSSAPGWGRSATAARGTSTRAGTGPRSTGCSCSPTTASSRRWACGSCPSRSASARARSRSRAIEDLVAMIETLRPAEGGRDDHRQRRRAANAVRVAQGTTQRSRWSCTTPAPLSRPDDVHAEIMSALGIGWWNLRFGLFGPEAVVAARYRMVRGGVRPHPGRRRSRAAATPATSPRPRSSPSTGRRPASRACMSDAILDGWRDARDGRTSGFSPLSPLRGEDAVAPGADGPVTGAGARVRLQRRADAAGTRFLNHIFELILFDPTDADAGRARSRAVRGPASARAPPPATASTGRTSSSWTSWPSSTTSTAARSAG